ncbi:MAG: oligosaccharide flippase family protein, partial [Acidobacteria bacterium]|nr:oligosaccharide flippase family protein [Acidobacteriota bacterium]
GAAYFSLQEWFASNGLGLSFLLIVPAIFLSGLMEVNSIWLNRNKSFRSISANKVIAAIVTASVSLTWAFLVNRTFLGLFAGLLIGQVAAVLFLHYESRKFRSGPMVMERALKLIKDFKDFPLFELPATLSNTAAIQLPVFMLGRFAGTEPVGHFNMSNRLLGMPALLIGTAMGEVFRQRATEDYHKHGNCRPILVKTFLTLAAIGLFPLVTVLLFGPWLFAFVLGEEWRTAGEYSRILAVLFFLRFCISPVTYVFYIANKQRQNLIGQTILLLCSFVPFILGFYFYRTVEASLLLYVMSYSLFYILYLALSFRYARS